jgi:hypothetical protein
VASPQQGWERSTRAGLRVAIDVHKVGVEEIGNESNIVNLMHGLSANDHSTSHFLDVLHTQSLDLCELLRSSHPRGRLRPERPLRRILPEPPVREKGACAHATLDIYRSVACPHLALRTQQTLVSWSGPWQLARSGSPQVRQRLPVPDTGHILGCAQKEHADVARDAPCVLVL